MPKNFLILRFLKIIYLNSIDNYYTKQIKIIDQDEPTRKKSSKSG